MNTLALKKIVSDMDINDKISLVELILADIKQQSNKYFVKDLISEKDKSMNIVDFEFCGIWENNSLLKNSSEFVRNLRQSEFRI